MSAEATPASRADLLYLVRPGDDNEELRYSLRSVAANLPHHRVWLAGYQPSWVTNVESIELDPLDNSFDNQMQSLRAACETERLAERFILMNDDFFVMRPIDAVPVLHGPTVREHHTWFLERGKRYEAPYLDGIRKTLAEVESWGVLDPLTYERHSPLPFSKRALHEMLSRAHARPFLWQTAYAAIAEDVGVYGPDAKNDTSHMTRHDQLRDFVEHQSPFLSSWDGSFKNGPIGEYVRATFPQRCRYELP